MWTQYFRSSTTVLGNETINQAQVETEHLFYEKEKKSNIQASKFCQVVKENQGWTVSVSDRFLWRIVRIRREMAEVERIQIIVVFSYCGKRFTLKGSERERI